MELVEIRELLCSVTCSGKSNLYLDRAITALDKHIADDEWKDISSAPKDGTRILVINGDVGGYGGCCGASQEAYSMGVSEFYRDKWCAIDCCDGVSTYKPTHWKHLPEPPREQEG